MPTFYDVDLHRARLREFAFGTPRRLMPLIAVVKVLGLPLPASTDDPPVETLAPFEVDEAALPEDVRSRILPHVKELAGLGFHSPTFHAIENPRLATRIFWVSLLHPTGRAWARVHCRLWLAEGRERVYVFPMVFSALDDGSFLVSSGGKQDMLMPAGVTMVNQVGATASDLWERHERELVERLPVQPVRIDGQARLRQALEQHHARLRDYNLARGVFKPLPPDEVPSVQPAEGAAEPVTLTPEDAAVLAALDRLQNQRAGWGNTLLILAVSLVLFVASFHAGPMKEVLWLLVPVIAFHELGHYLAMRWFGYRNLRMFFIPFFGAAVTGRNYNVAGWKKAVVALMGPVPGVAAGAALGIAGLAGHWPALTAAALLMMILNGFNLLPLLPLDGGWVVHAVLFVRHPLLDVLFRLLAVLALFGLAVFSGDRILIAVCVLLLIGLPMTWRVARTARRLRERGVVAVSPDARSIAPEAALPILAELRARLGRPTAPKILAQLVANVFETLNAHPPGVLASLGLLAVHAGSFLAALVLAVVFTMGPRSPLLEPPEPPLPRPANVYTPGTTRVWRGPDAPAAPTEDRVTFIATFANDRDAWAAFEALPAELPRNATLRWFGGTVFLTLPADREEQRDHWTERLRPLARRVLVDRKDFPVSARLSCLAPNAQEATELEAELRQYLHGAPNGNLLLPPWSGGWESFPVEDRLQFRKARQTMTRLQDIPVQVRQNPTAEMIEARLALILPNRDAAANRATLQALERATRAEEQRLRDKLRAEGQDAVDLPLIDIWEEYVRPGGDAAAEGDGSRPDRPEQPANPAEWEALRARLAARGKARAELLKKMAQRMGPIPHVGDKPVPGRDQDAARVGHVRRQGRQLVVAYIVFHHPAEGLAALAGWLSQHGCTQLRYDFGLSPDEEGPDPDRPEAP